MKTFVFYMVIAVATTTTSFMVNAIDKNKETTWYFPFAESECEKGVLISLNKVEMINGNNKAVKWNSKLPNTYILNSFDGGQVLLTTSREECYRILKVME